MLDVLVTMRFDEGQLARLRAVSPDIRVRQAPPDAADYRAVDVLYAGTPPRDLSRAPALKWVQLQMAGIDALAQHPLYTESTLPLTTTSAVHGAAIAEYAVTVLLALAHRVPRMVEWQRRGGWPPDERRWELFVPTEVRGATLGVIGYGSIGREVARIAKSAFGMRVLAIKRDPSRRADDGYCQPGTGDPDGRLPDEWLGLDGLDSVLARSDVVVLCVPLTGETRGLMDARAFARMRPSSHSAYSGVNSSGIWLIDSIPPASTSEAPRASIRYAASATASIPEAQLRWTVAPGTRSGTPASRAATRATLAASAGWAQLPRTTSSMVAGSTS